MLRWQVASPLVVLVEANGFLFSTPTSFLISLSHLFLVSPTLPPLPHRHNFDVRKGPISSEWFVGAGKKEGLFLCEIQPQNPRPRLRGFMFLSIFLTSSPKKHPRSIPETNICYNCVDRHVEAGLGDRVAFLFEGNDLDVSTTTTYAQLKDQVVRIANWLRANGVRKGDDVTLYMPMVPELPAAMLACARLGAVHSVVFGGFSADALAARIGDSKSRIVLTASAVRRGAKPIPLKAVVDAAVAKCAKSASEPHRVERVLVLDKPEAAARADVPFDAGRDEWWQDALALQPADDSAPIEWVGAEHPLFKLYTSGSTGKPKGVIHSTAGYMVRTRSFFKLFFPPPIAFSLSPSPASSPFTSFFIFFIFFIDVSHRASSSFASRGGTSLKARISPQRQTPLYKKNTEIIKKNEPPSTQVGTATTFKHVFDYKPGQDVYWCTADCGWITGHSYVTYGPLLHAATQVRMRKKKREREREVKLERERIFRFLRRATGDFFPPHFSLPQNEKTTTGHLRRRSHLPRRRTHVADRRQARGHAALHRSDGHPRPRGHGRRLCHSARQVVASRAGVCRGADRPAGVALVPWRGGRREVPHRGHVVADGDG